MSFFRRYKRRGLRRGSRRDGCGKGHRDVLDVRTPPGTLLREGLDWVLAMQEDIGSQQVGQVSFIQHYPQQNPVDGPSTLH